MSLIPHEDELMRGGRAEAGDRLSRLHRTAVERAVALSRGFIRIDQRDLRQAAEDAERDISEIKDFAAAHGFTLRCPGDDGRAQR